MNPLHVLKSVWSGFTTVLTWQWYLSTAGWVWLAIVQLITMAFTVAGWVILIPFCLAQAWETSPVKSIGWQTGRGPVDRWKWAPLNWVYGNPEDGVSGQTALIWGSGLMAGKLVGYMPGSWAPWRAYCWSALRNSADNLKYVFQWRGAHPPFISKTFVLFGRTFTYTAGWKVENVHYLVPVISLR